MQQTDGQLEILSSPFAVRKEMSHLDCSDSKFHSPKQEGPADHIFGGEPTRIIGLMSRKLLLNTFKMKFLIEREAELPSGC